MILGCNATTDSSTWPTNRGSRYFHGQSTFLGGRWYRERGATRGGRDAAEWDENRHRSETLMPVSSLYGVTPLYRFPRLIPWATPGHGERRGPRNGRKRWRNFGRCARASLPRSVSSWWSVKKNRKRAIK